MSTRELFGDDDDDDDSSLDDDAAAAAPAPPAAATTKAAGNKKTTKTTKELFGDADDDDSSLEDSDDDSDADDDDEEDSVDRALNQASKAAPKKTKSDKQQQKQAAGSGTSDAAEPAEKNPAAAEDDEGKEGESVGEKKKPAAATKTTTELFGDDDSSSEDEDVEFDDKDAQVVGLSSEAAGVKKKKAPGSGEGQEEGLREGEDGGDSATGAPGSSGPVSKTVKKDTRHLMILEKPANDAAGQQQQQPSLHITKLPNLVGIQTTPFNPATYDADEEEDEFGGAVHNLVRWRYKKKNTSGAGGNSTSADDIERDPTTDTLLRESNSRLVQWEDGSWTMHVGPNEAFEIDVLDNSTSGGGGGATVAPAGRFPGLNGYLYLSQKATFVTKGEVGADDDADDTSTPTPDKEEPAGTVLECMGAIQNRFTVRPSSLQSEAHKSLTVAVRQKTIKKAKIAEYVTQEDPEVVKAARIKNKEELAKAEKRKRDTNRQQQQYGGGGRSGGGYQRPRMSRDYLEEDDDFDTTDIRAMKRRAFGDDDDDMDDYGQDSDEDEMDDAKDTTFNRRGRSRGALDKPSAAAKKRKAAADDDDDDMDDFIVDDDDDGDDDDDDDDDDEIVAKPISKTSHTKKRPQLAVLDDDDDDSD